jgi:ADP-heptose:LPS heptosyltransferase
MHKDSSYHFPLQNKVLAANRGVENNVLLKIEGGLGDIVCAEPAIRFAMHQFKGINWTIQSTSPELFGHLGAKLLRSQDKVNLDEYLVLEGVKIPDSLIWQFLPHMTIHSVDYWSMALFGWQQTREFKQIQLPDFACSNMEAQYVKDNAEDFVIIHAGKHFPSKTFSAKWWDSIIREFKAAGFKVCLVGKTIDKHCGYVQTTESVDVDLRDKLGLFDFVDLLKKGKYLFSNDSAAIHIAAAGDSFIGFIASIKHPDYITHTRNNQFGYKTKNFANGFLGDIINISFNNTKLIELNDLPAVIVNKLLPEASEVAGYYKELRNVSR